MVNKTPRVSTFLTFLSRTTPLKGKDRTSFMCGSSAQLGVFVGRGNFANLYPCCYSFAKVLDQLLVWCISPIQLYRPGRQTHRQVTLAGTELETHSVFGQSQLGEKLFSVKISDQIYSSKTTTCLKVDRQRARKVTFSFSLISQRVHLHAANNFF